MNAPLLSVSTSDRIDVEKLKDEITMKVDKTKIESEERKEVEKEIEEVAISFEIATVISCRCWYPFSSICRIDEKYLMKLGTN